MKLSIKITPYILCADFVFVIQKIMGFQRVISPLESANFEVMNFVYILWIRHAVICNLLHENVVDIV